MKRILRSFLTLLMLVVWASGFAQTTVTFDATKDKGTSTSTTLTKDGVTLNFGKGKLDDGEAYRWYAQAPPNTYNIINRDNYKNRIHMHR